ncbi:MAG: tRNA uridine-5-carboxymethylaminomethyl(34) synthesis GTPase MnmE [Victivallaceae bacterium]|nr:tRNA uridine-5-carboxymethylaminomethyl(34) synthesis GTPase MnmE [Victivallaceae bacterium]
MNTDDTIAAICTGLGGAISIIRISGTEALQTAAETWSGTRKLSKSSARTMLLGKIVTDNDQTGDPALAVYMPGPNSYTGDDVVELHCHGGTLSARRTLNAVITNANGARMAEPGEFTYRAFMNGKMDLTQAEAVADLINAHSEMALHMAERQVDGVLKDIVNNCYTELTDLLAECESRMDFAEEDLGWSNQQVYQDKINRISQKIERLIASGREGGILRNGIRVVLAGRPNSGKSSLLNLLLGYDRAIVTDLPGTTRDILEETANLRNIPVKLTDTAGIREATDLIEGLGIDRSKQSLKQAQAVFWLLDASTDNLTEEIDEMLAHAGNNKVIAIWNKIDAVERHSLILPDIIFPTVEISVEQQLGIDELLDKFETVVWEYPHDEEPEVAVSARHAALLAEVFAVLPEVIETTASSDWELAAVHLRAAIAALGAITGENITPDVLDNIFSRFCIGK